MAQSDQIDELFQQLIIVLASRPLRFVLARNLIYNKM